MFKVHMLPSSFLQTLYMVTTWIGYFGLLTTFSPSFMWVLILRGLVGAGLAGSPQR